MITGIGTDIVKISRIRDAIGQYGDQFLRRCFTDGERARAETKHDPAHAYARLFAAKESLLKALGTGMRQGLSWQDFKISWDDQGAPQVLLGPGAVARLPVQNVNIRLSMSDDGDYAVAFAVIEKNMMTQNTKDIQPVHTNTTYETVKTIFFAALIALTIRSLAFEPFSIPSGSMVPTLLVGDYLFVSKSSYGYSRYSFPLAAFPIQGRIKARPAERGDVVVFRKPHNERIDYIKRVIGLPGDQIQVKKGRLYINRQMVERTFIGDYKIKLQPEPDEISYKRYREDLPGGTTHEIIERSDSGPLDDTELFTVPEGHYFMMGDNRDGSQDSRVMSEVGYVPFENFIGKARNIFFSLEDGTSVVEIWKWPEAIRAKRFLQKII